MGAYGAFRYGRTRERMKAATNDSGAIVWAWTLPQGNRFLPVQDPFEVKARATFERKLFTIHPKRKVSFRPRLKAYTKPQLLICIY